MTNPTCRQPAPTPELSNCRYTRDELKDFDTGVATFVKRLLVARRSAMPT
ncbi:hypothetical protein [Streptomyces sp. NPDC002676]